MDDQSGTGPSQWKSARSYGATANGFAVILFATLIASFPAMWAKIGVFRNALSERQWVRTHKSRVDQAYEALFAQNIKGRLSHEYLHITNPQDSTCTATTSDVPSAVYLPPLPEDDKTQQERVKNCRKRLLEAADAAVNDPYGTVEDLKKKHDWRESFIERAIELARDQLRDLRSKGSKSFQANQRAAEQIPFKLLGLEFSVNSFWGWDVWYLFLGGGVLYLWLTRRGLLLRCRLAFRDATDESPAKISPPEQSTQTKGHELLQREGEKASDKPTKEVQGKEGEDSSLEAAPAERPPSDQQPKARPAGSDSGLIDKEAITADSTAERTRGAQAPDSLPLWTRPLPSDEPWVNSWTNPVGVDCFLDPNSLLCVLLMWCCLLLAVFPVLPLSISSYFLLIGVEKPAPSDILHAALCCVTTGCMAGLLLDWYLPAWRNKRSSGARASKYTAIVNRRVFFLGIAATIGATALYFDPFNRAVVRSLLRKPRFNHAPILQTSRKRRRKIEPIKLSEGFYQDRDGGIYHVPADGRSRSLSRIRISDLRPWTVPLEPAKLKEVWIHQSARIAFARFAVSQLLHGIRHRKRPEDKAALLNSPEVREKYKAAFEIVRWIIQQSGEDGSGRNFQLYDLLAAVAIGANSNEMLHKARRMLASVPPRHLRRRDAPTPIIPEENPQQRTKHSRHAKRKAKRKLRCDRNDRLNAFRWQRLGSRQPGGTTPPGPLKTEAAFHGSWRLGVSIKESNSIRLIRKKRKRKHNLPYRTSLRKPVKCA